MVGRAGFAGTCWDLLGHLGGEYKLWEHGREETLVEFDAYLMNLLGNEVN